MQKKSTKDIYEKILKYLENKRQATIFEIKRKIDLDDEELDYFLNELSGKDNKHLIKIINEPHNTKDEHKYEITIKGISFLNDLSIKKRQMSINLSMFFVTTILTIIAILNYMNTNNTFQKSILNISPGEVSTVLLIIILSLIIIFNIYYLILKNTDYFY